MSDTIEGALDALRSEDPEVRQRAAWRLSLAREPRVTVALEQMALNDTGQITVEGAFVDSSEAIYPDALNALRSIYDREGLKPEDIARMDSLLQGPIDHPNGTYRVLALGGEAMRPLLREALDDPRPAVVIRAMKTLILLKEPGAGITKLRHPDPQVRRAAIELFRVYNDLRPETVDEWYQQLVCQLGAEPDADLRLAIIKSMRYTQTLEDAAALIHCRYDSDERFRAAAAEKLKSFRSVYSPEVLMELATKVMVWAQSEPNPKVQAKVAAYLASLPHTSAASWMIVLLKDSDPNLRKLAARQLCWAKRRTAAGPLLKAAKDEDPGVRCAALVTLAKLGEGRALPLIEREFNDPAQAGARYELNLARWELEAKVSRRLERR